MNRYSSKREASLSTLSKGTLFGATLYTLTETLTALSFLMIPYIRMWPEASLVKWRWDRACQGGKAEKQGQKSKKKDKQLDLLFTGSVVWALVSTVALAYLTAAHLSSK